MKNFFLTIVLWTAVIVSTAGTCVAQPAGSWIVPGVRFGSVVLGMTRPKVEEILGTPKLSRHLSRDAAEESWTSALSPKQEHYYHRQGQYWNRFFVNVYLIRDRVVQVESNSPWFRTGNNLTSKSPADTLERKYRPFQVVANGSSQTWLYPLNTPLGVPAAKHFVTVEDDSKAGIGWRYGAWGDLAPEPNPAREEIVIVHLPNKKLILEPDGGNRFVLSR